MNRVVDYSALLYPVPREQVEAYKRATQGRRDAQMGNVGQIIGMVITLFMLGSMILTALFVGGAVLSFSDGANPVGVGGGLFLLVFVGICVVIGVAVIRAILKGGDWETRLRLDTFARANGMVFSARDANPRYPGAIFNHGDSRVVTNHLTSATDRFLDIGNYQYTTGSGDNRSTHRWGFMALHLDRRLPNMVLDAKANNGLFGTTNLPASFDKKQILSLEGNFNEYFTLYCPRQYERDALYVFTPDLMALLIDNAAPFDVEIVDDWMFVYSATPFPSTAPGLYQRLFRIVDTVGAKTISQTDRYVDQNIGDFAANVVAPHGQRLRRGWSVGAIVVLAVFLTIWGLPQLIAFFSVFSR